MRMVEEVEIEEKYKELPFTLNRTSGAEDVREFVEWVQKIPSELRQKKVLELASIMLQIFSSFPSWKAEQTNKELRENVLLGIELLAVVSGESSASVECVRFLYELHKNVGQHNTSDVARKYFLFQDILPKQKGLFSLLEEDGTRVFPIHELVSCLAKDFKCDNEHLINLAVAQQMFEKVEEYDKIEGYDKIKEELKKIAKNHQIAFLESLAEGGELYLDEIDYRENGTLIVKKDRDIIIRNIRKSYFCNYPEAQVEPEMNQMAWFVRDKLEEGEELADFAEIIGGEIQQNKLDMLATVDSKKNYNVFLAKRIVRDRVNHKFHRFLNKGIDRKIVYKGAVQEHDRTGFLKMLCSKEARLRCKWLWKREWDILTVDFYCAFYLEVSEEDWPLVPDLESGKDDFYQRNLIKNYLAYIFEKKENNEVDVFIERFYQFVNNYFDYTKITSNSSMRGRLFAFPFLGVLSELLNTNKWLVMKKNELLGNEEDTWKIKELYYDSGMGKWYIDGDDCEDYEILTPDKLSLQEAGIKLPKGRTSVYHSQEARQIIYDEKIYKAERKLNFLNNLMQQEIVQYEYYNLYCGRELKKLIQVMVANNFSASCYEEFQCDQSDYEIFCFYKVCWHMQKFQLENARVKKFWCLMLDKHYLGCIEKTDIIEKYFQKMSQFMVESGTVVLAKESSGNESTLQYLYEEFSKKRGERNYLSWSFDQGEINKHLSFQSEAKQYIWKGSPLKKIIFMADNLMSGQSLKKMLKFHMDEVDDKKRSYLRISPSVHEMIEKQKIDVEVHVIFGFNDSIKEIEDEYGVRIIIHEEIPTQYKADNDTIELVNELYGKQGERKGVGCCCVYRYNNLPFASVLPKYIRDPYNCVGLFQRKGEI